jgi:PAS domain S-box-containing protein
LTERFAGTVACPAREPGDGIPARLGPIEVRLMPEREAGRAANWRLPVSPFPMWIVDRHSGAIVGANDAAVEAYGYTREQLLACTVDDICPPQGPGDGLLMAPRTDVTPLVRALRQRRRDGSTFEADIATIDCSDAERTATMVLVRATGAREGS